MGIMQKVRELGRTRPAAPVKRAAKRAIDLVDGTTFRARPAPTPEGPISSFYERYGYAIFRDVIDQSKVDALRATVESEVIASDRAFLRHQSVERESNVFLQGTRLPNDGLLNAHAQPETPRTAAAIESLLLTDGIANLLTSIDGANNYTVHQTILFFMPPGTHLHLDGWSFDTEPRGYFHTVWIPLEPVGLHNGPIFIVSPPTDRSDRKSPITLPLNPTFAATRPITLCRRSIRAIWWSWLRPHRTAPCRSNRRRAGQCRSSFAPAIFGGVHGPSSPPGSPPALKTRGDR
jgi:hypothetical protein